jgi:hypothetical protein
MTLQQQFENAPFTYDEDLNRIVGYEKIADDYAIGFLGWYLIHQRTICTNEMYLRISNKQLLEIYKKEKGL